jgi:predicted permease
MRLFRRRVSDDEIDAELRYHLDQLIAANLREGMTEEEARRLALIDFGSMTREAELCRDIRPLQGLTSLLADLSYGARRLRQAPVFTATVLLSLAAGIGASSALFSLVNAAPLRTIAVQHPEQLVWFDSGSHGRALSYPFYEQIRADSRFDGVISAFATPVNVSSAGVSERIEAELVSSNYFEVLGLQPHLGRMLSSADHHQPVAVLSHAFWQARLGASAEIVGRMIRINGSSWTVVGVAAPGFSGLDRAYKRALFVPLGMKPQITPGWNGLDKPLIAWLHIVGRVRPGVDRAQLGTELNAQFHSFQEAHLPGNRELSLAQRQLIRGRRLRLESLGNAVIDSRVGSHLSTLAWMVGLLLGLACANVAGLLVSQGIERRRELATRLSIGASRGRIVRQLLSEALLLAAAGGVLGLIAAAFVSPVLASRFPLAGSGSNLDVPLDFTVLAFTFAVSLLVSLLFGATPAWHATKLDLSTALKGSASAPSTGRMRNALLAAQISLSVVLLSAAVLFTANLRALLVQDTGFDRQRLLLAELEPTLSGYDEAARQKLYAAIEARLHALRPRSFVSASIANVAPMSPSNHWTSLFLVKGREQEKDRIVRAVAVGTNYFETLRIPLRKGRLPQAHDNASAPRVAVISESLARREFPDEDPIGKSFIADLRSPAETTFQIVGVVGDTDLSDLRTDANRACVYLPYRQWAFTPQSIVLHARLTPSGSALAAAAAMREAVRELDPTLALYGVRTVEQATESLLASERLAALLTTFFGLTAALLCALGIYGAVSREMAARTKEAAIRIALGGRWASVIWQLARRPVLAVLIGLIAGLLLLLAISPVLQPLLTSVQTSDPLVVGGAITALMALTMAAIAMPARRVRKLQPAAILRQD